MYTYVCVCACVYEHVLIPESPMSMSLSTRSSGFGKSLLDIMLSACVLHDCDVCDECDEFDDAQAVR